MYSWITMVCNWHVKKTLGIDISFDPPVSLLLFYSQNRRYLYAYHTICSMSAPFLGKPDGYDGGPQPVFYEHTSFDYTPQTMKRTKCQRCFRRLQLSPFWPRIHIAFRYVESLRVAFFSLWILGNGSVHLIFLDFITNIIYISLIDSSWPCSHPPFSVYIPTHVMS